EFCQHFHCLGPAFWNVRARNRSAHLRRDGTSLHCEPGLDATETVVPGLSKTADVSKARTGVSFFIEDIPSGSLFHRRGGDLWLDDVGKSLGHAADDWSHGRHFVFVAHLGSAVGWTDVGRSR